MAAWDESMKMQEIKTNHGYISLTTSDKPEVVQKLHMITDRTNKEMAAIMAKEKAREAQDE
jgi:hypothetical protein